MDSGRGHDIQDIGGKVSGDYLRAGLSYEGTRGNTLSVHCDSLVRQITGQQQVSNIVHRGHE